MSIFWILLLGVLSPSRAAPIVDPTISTDDQTQAEDYLHKFYTDNGVLRVTTQSLDSARNFTGKLKSMQAFFGLEVTGSLNNETLEVMKAPRCGVPDVNQYEFLQGKPKWNKNLITYRITQYTSKLSQREVDATIAQAFKLYSDVIPLNFQQIYIGTADIMILFQGGDHGDFHPFDGPGGVLAHASGPGNGLGGDAHFDEDETWTLTQQGTNLLLVAAHEIGHTLGLDHSKKRGALMYPYYQYVNTNGYKLPDDDKWGVQALYVSPNNQPVTTVDICGTPPIVLNGEYDVDRNTYVFYRCRDWYRLKGKHTVVCRNGQWTPAPTCEVDFCMVDPSKHSDLVNIPSFFKSGAMVMVDCANDSRMKARAQCNQNRLYLSECCTWEEHDGGDCPNFLVPQ